MKTRNVLHAKDPSNVKDKKTNELNEEIETEFPVKTEEEYQIRRKRVPTSSTSTTI